MVYSSLSIFMKAGELCCLFLFLFRICAANHCAPSSCGNILNISEPFRLKSDPPGCGDSRYELSCENNSPVIHLGGIGKFNVKSINYGNYTLRLADPAVDREDCSAIPRIPISNALLADPNIPYLTSRGYAGGGESAGTISFIRCRDPMRSSDYLDRSSCVSDPEFYSYAYLGELSLYDLGESCGIEMLSMLPIINRATSISIVEIQREMASGFELYWYRFACEKMMCPPKCSLEINNTVSCSPFSLKHAGIFKTVVYVFQDLPLHIEETFRSHFNMKAVLFQIRMLHAANFHRDVVVRVYQVFYSWGFLGVFLILRNICATPLILAFVIHKWRRRHLSDYNTIEEFLQSQNNLNPIRYRFSDFKKMTDGFKDKLGKGGFGSVYKGKLRSGQLVAIKMLENPEADGQDFINEVATVGRIHHANIVQLVGFCFERSKFALLYEFMPNGSLDNHIVSRQGVEPLSWEKLYEISVGVARGIKYLHQGCEMQILHFDIKPHNILLDENFQPNLSDFGLAKFHNRRDSDVTYTAAKGTIGYMAPELFYKNIGGVSYKADVYSFGKLLLEMTGKRNNLSALLDNSDQSYYSHWVYDQLFYEKFTVEDEAEPENEIARKMIIVGLWCIQMQPSSRPPMEIVVEMLEADLESLQLPPRPLLYPAESSQPTDTESAFVSHDFTESCCFGEDNISNLESSSLIQNNVN